MVAPSRDRPKCFETLRLCLVGDSLKRRGSIIFFVILISLALALDASTSESFLEVKVSNDGIFSKNAQFDDRKHSNATKPEACFVTAVYSSSADAGDRPPGVRKIKENNPTFEFFVFTNLDEIDAPGWSHIKLDFPQYRRDVTKSRWPKFMGWKHHRLQNCQAVFYVDGYCRPRERLASRFRELSRKISESSTGLFQNRHKWGGGPLEEFKRILEKGKDDRENVEASINWLQEQPDFRETCTLYSNQYIGYDPKSIVFQKAATYFWSRYSLELDSFRDQPLWCYTLDRFNITPSDFEPMEMLFKEYPKRMGFGGHKYAQ